MKVIIISNYSGRIPTCIIPFLGRGGKDEWRWGEAIHYIESNASDDIKSDAKIIKYPGDSLNSIRYFFKDTNAVLSIVDVHPGRPWTILQYDGAEYIQYLDYKVVNQAFGFCKLPDAGA